MPAEGAMSAMSIENEALVAVIRDRLLQDRRVAALAIDVRCCEGFVSLVGCVDTVEQKELAVQLVRGMVGVRSVEDELVVRGPTSELAASSPGGDAAGRCSAV